MALSSSVLIALEISGTLGVVLILGGWELWSLRREKQRDREREEAARQADNRLKEPER